MRPNVLTSLLSFLLMAFSCLGQAYTYRDEAFMRFAMGLGPGGTGIPVCRPFNQNLIRYWKMVDPSLGNWLYDDVTESPYSASMNNGAIWVNDGPQYIKWNNGPFRPLYCVQCPDWNSWCNAGTGEDYYFFNIVSTNYSVSAWTYRFNVPANRYECAIGGFGPSGGFHFGLGIHRDAVHYGWGDVTIGNAEYYPGPTIASVGANWTFWVMTRIGTKWTLWKNDPVSGPATEVTNTTQGSQDLPCRVWIGNQPNSTSDSSRNWKGYVCEAMIYKDYGLSSNDVWCLYHQYYGR